jgi:hypothetical protein
MTAATTLVIDIFSTNNLKRTNVKIEPKKLQKRIACGHKLGVLGHPPPPSKNPQTKLECSLGFLLSAPVDEARRRREETH